MNNTHDKANRRQEHADDGITQNPRRRTLLPYLMVSATQTLVEFGSFTLLHLLTVPSTIANAVAIVLSASYNFLMNRNVTFKSSSNFTRSVILFITLWSWNYLFGSTMLTWLPLNLGWNAILVKFLTMGCQFAWGYPLCKHVIFR